MIRLLNKGELFLTDYLIPKQYCFTIEDDGTYVKCLTAFGIQNVRKIDIGWPLVWWKNVSNKDYVDDKISL